MRRLISTPNSGARRAHDAAARAGAAPASAAFAGQLRGRNAVRARRAANARLQGGAGQELRNAAVGAGEGTICLHSLPPSRLTGWGVGASCSSSATRCVQTASCNYSLSSPFAYCWLRWDVCAVGCVAVVQPQRIQSICAELRCWRRHAIYCLFSIRLFSTTLSVANARTSHCCKRQWCIVLLTPRALAMMKLYVVFNLLEVCDKLCCSFGMDILDSLHMRISRSNTVPLQQHHHHINIIIHYLLAISYVCTCLYGICFRSNNTVLTTIVFCFYRVTYTLCTLSVAHAILFLYQTVTLNVAINSHNALFSLLISNQFVEIKSSVFKRFEAENLFQLSCSDIVERFTLSVFLSINVVRNFLELSANTVEPPPQFTYWIPSIIVQTVSSLIEMLAQMGSALVNVESMVAYATPVYNWLLFRFLQVGVTAEYLVSNATVTVVNALDKPQDLLQNMILLTSWSWEVTHQTIISTTQNLPSIALLFWQLCSEMTAVTVTLPASTRLVWAVVSPALIMMASEVLVDWLKHAFITKFNGIRPSIYKRYRDVFSQDLVRGLGVLPDTLPAPLQINIVPPIRPSTPTNKKSDAIPLSSNSRSMSDSTMNKSLTNNDKDISEAGLSDKRPLYQPMSIDSNLNNDSSQFQDNQARATADFVPFVARKLGFASLPLAAVLVHMVLEILDAAFSEGIPTWPLIDTLRAWHFLPSTTTTTNNNNNNGNDMHVLIEFLDQYGGVACGVAVIYLCLLSLKIALGYTIIELCYQRHAKVSSIDSKDTPLSTTDEQSTSSTPISASAAIPFSVLESDQHLVLNPSPLSGRVSTPSPISKRFELTPSKRRTTLPILSIAPPGTIMPPGLATSTLPDARHHSYKVPEQPSWLIKQSRLELPELPRVTGMTPVASSNTSLSVAGKVTRGNDGHLHAEEELLNKLQHIERYALVKSRIP